MQKVLRQFDYIFILGFLGLTACTSPRQDHYDLVILGGGTGGTTAAIQASRLGVHTLLVETTPWLGGMLTSAGVSAIDGNHRLPSGLWGEFRDSLYAHYGSAAALSTGWVSNTQFEPSVGARILRQMATNPHLVVKNGHHWSNLRYAGKKWSLDLLSPSGQQAITANLLIDGTDLGDVAKAVGAAYDLGMEARDETGEEIAPLQANKIIQDFTYVAILKTYDTLGTSHILINPPPGYQREMYLCSCQTLCDSARHACETMLTYAKLPGHKYMINWPLNGNDFYANMVELDEAARDSIYALAKNRTLGFIYFMQNELGWKHLGLADDEYATPDRLPYLPYHREGRRIQGKTRFTLKHVQDPFSYTLYRTGVGCGDYPVDHHHKQNPLAPDLEFYPVPSFNVPAGSLVPAKVPHLIIADKAISVSNILNGATRLQPVVMQIGQAAGTLAALSLKHQRLPTEVSIREWQDSLVRNGVYIMPYLDVPREHAHFGSVQRVGATGILKGHPVPHQWANQTWFYPDSLLVDTILMAGLLDYGYTVPSEYGRGIWLTAEELIRLLQAIEPSLNWDAKAFWEIQFKVPFEAKQPVTRMQVAVVLDQILKVFYRKELDWEGRYK